MVDELRTDQAHSARMYDFYLGGHDNYEADRAAAARVLKVFPTAPEMARANRDFMNRAVEYLARQGISQFLDIGTGIPTEPNLHQTAQAVDPAARVVYVDNDPLVLTHARALMQGTPEGRTAFVAADACDAEAILQSPELSATLDLAQPVALSLVALLHFLPDSRRPLEALQTIAAALAPGSWLVISQATGDFAPDTVAEAVRIYRESGLDPQVRSRDEITEFFTATGFELVAPGLVPPHRWPTDTLKATAGADERVSFYAGVGRKR
ncbi:SAM-dependent methyltransferase [Nocardia veterana]|uniref:SAM-dependent methyltransferase n=1 Tax=Nocardia veterana TaxID=132249 RepID=A0A7X6RK45_9NOCA|nr:SAM-dependent methyltransferase [Nocardia veterana]NKY88851.1 SAM-dependent methyltransferase [Nocardia veterana]